MWPNFKKLILSHEMAINSLKTQQQDDLSHSM